MLSTCEALCEDAIRRLSFGFRFTRSNGFVEVLLMAIPRTVAVVKHDSNNKDWVVQSADSAQFRYQTLVEALTCADDCFKEEGDTITVHYPDRRIELLLAPVDLLATLLRNR